MDKENLPSAEQNSRAELLSFFDLEDDQKLALKEKIEARHGWIEIWVHTHFDEKTLGKTSDYGSKEDAEAYFQKRERLIGGLNRSNRMPVFVLIPHAKDGEAKTDYEEIYRIGGASESIYFIETASDDPVPFRGLVASEDYSNLRTLINTEPLSPNVEQLKLVGRILGMNDGVINESSLLRIDGFDWRLLLRHAERTAAENFRQATDENWELLLQTLRDFGVKGAVVRGRNYFRNVPFFQSSGVDTEFGKLAALQLKNTREFPSGCAGEVCKRLLLKDFDLRVSTITYPDQPSPEFRQALRSK